jgi:hypothetical protein
MRSFSRRRIKYGKDFPGYSLGVDGIYKLGNPSFAKDFFCECAKDNFLIGQIIGSIFYLNGDIPGALSLLDDLLITTIFET